MRGMIIKRNPLVTSKRIGSQWIILEPNKKYVRSLNPTAGFIWALTATPASAHEITRKVAKHYNARTEDVQKDVEDFLRHYIREGFLVAA